MRDRYGDRRKCSNCGLLKKELNHNGVCSDCEDKRRVQTGIGADWGSRETGKRVECFQCGDFF